MNKTIPTDPNKQQELASNPQHSVWVDASAGTGKTKVLSDRVLRLLLNGIYPEKILCITYTNAAAAEMYNRITKTLQEWAIADEKKLKAEVSKLTKTNPDNKILKTARRLFAEIVDSIDELKIMTIHSFCQSLLKRFPLEADIPSNFSLLDELDQHEIFDEAFKRLLMQSQYDEKLSSAIGYIAQNTSDTGIVGIIKIIISNRKEITNLLARYKSPDNIINEIHDILGITSGETRENLINKFSKKSDRASLQQLAQTLLSSSKITDNSRGTILSEWVESGNNFEEYWSIFLKKTDSLAKKLSSIITKEPLGGFPEAEKIIEQEQNLLLELNEALNSLTIAMHTSSFIHVAEALLSLYENYKQQMSLLDYDDLILKTLNLLENKEISPWIIFKLDGGIDYLLLDEAQDTSPEQWRIIQFISEEFFVGKGSREIERRTFMVGDKKQSIYSFQGARPEHFAIMHQYFEEKSKDAKHTWQHISLQTSFRSTEPILEAVDAVFSNGELAKAITSNNEKIKHYSSRLNEPGKVEIWDNVVEEALLVDDTPWQAPIKRKTKLHAKDKLAEKITQTIVGWIQEGRPIIRGGEYHPVSAGDIMVLVRHRDDFIEKLVKKLKKAQIEVAGIDRLNLEEHLAIMDLVAMGDVTLLMADDLTLATVLRSPLINLSEDELFYLSFERKSSLWESLKEKRDTSKEFAEAYDKLNRIIKLSRNKTPYDFYTHLLDVLGSRKRLLRRFGDEANDPINEFLGICYSYQQKHTSSLQGFLHWFKTRNIEIKRNLEQKTNAVRIMTVHAAKGLQSPIVFLADTTTMPKRHIGIYWCDNGTLLWPGKKENFNKLCEKLFLEKSQEEDNEYLRLLYVAMTRAQNELYICGHVNEKKGAHEKSWYSIVRNALDPIAELTDRGIKISNEHDIISEVAANKIDKVREIEPLPDYIYQPSKQSKKSDTGYSLKTKRNITDKKFAKGNAIHTLLEILPNAKGENRQPLAKMILDNNFPQLEDVHKEIVSETLSVMEDKRLSHLFTPESIAEATITGTIEDSTLRRVDRLIVTDSEVLIIDYKTNKHPPNDKNEIPDIYIEQMNIYKSRLSKIYPKKDVKCFLLWTNNLFLQEI